MYEFRSKVGQNGRVLIPAECRKMLGFSIGDEVVILVDDQEARIFSLDHAVDRAQNIMKKYLKKGEKMSDDLIASRREEADNE